METSKRQKLAEANRVARTLKRLRSPEVGQLASEFWSMLNSLQHIYDTEVATKLYLKAGYLPFSGYPLVRRQPLCSRCINQEQKISKQKKFIK